MFLFCDCFAILIFLFFFLQIGREYLCWLRMEEDIGVD